MAADPKPIRRKKATRVEWRHLRNAKCGPCRVCGGNGNSLHHLVPRSLGGDDVADNLVPLCGTGTTGCHGLIEHREPRALAALRYSLTRDERNYAAGKKGVHWIARYYPRLEEAA